MKMTQLPVVEAVDATRSEKNWRLGRWRTSGVVVRWQQPGLQWDWEKAFPQPESKLKAEVLDVVVSMVGQHQEPHSRKRYELQVR